MKLSSTVCPHLASQVSPQAINENLTASALFLTLKLEDSANPEQVTGVLGNLSGLTRGVGFRDATSTTTCIGGIGSDAWDKIFQGKFPRPKELHPFKEIKGAKHAPSTPGDLFFHIRGPTMDLCFELGYQITRKLEGAAKVIDEVHGFKNFDMRDLLGFVDGTENPTGISRLNATLIGEGDDAEYTGSSYVIIQKYLHDLKSWEALSTERQEKIIGRKKLSDIELEDDEKESYSHNVLTSIEDDEGNDLDILRDNMPFGSIEKGEFGTFFIGYAKSPSVTETMLNNMFVGKPEGNYDRILDYSTAATGNLFFCPSTDFLDGLGDD